MRKILLFVISALILEHSGFGQAYTIETVAGRGWDIPGASANLSSLQGVAVDGAGNVFMALAAYSAVVRMDPSGQLTLLAGNGTQGFSGDKGPATLAQLDTPAAIALDAAGNVYIVDSGNDVIRRVSNGVITTVAGGGSAYPGDNGPATSARLGLSPGNGPGLAADSAGGIYFADTNGIRKVSNGVITTVAGGGFAFGDNIPATSASVNAVGIAIDDAGRIYFADGCSNRIRRVSNGVITTVAGNGIPVAFSCAQPVAGGNGNATSVPLNAPQGVAVDSAGNVYFMEGALSGSTEPARARKVSNGAITTVAGGNTGPPFGAAVSDGVPATGAVLAFAKSIAVDAAGNLYIPDEYWSARMLPDGNGTYTPSPELGRLRKVSNGVITTIAGSAGDNGPAIGAQLNLPAGVAADDVGNIYFADAGNNIIRQVSGETITTIAGNRSDGGVQGDGGPATSANLFNPQGVARDAATGNLYFTETGSGSIRKISGGIITTAAAGVSRSLSVALDVAGNLYVADFGGNRILKASGGVVNTIAGNGTSGFSGDNGPATSAQLAGPSGIGLDASGNVYFTDTLNQRVREVSNGVITTVAGTGTAGFSGDNGLATNAQFSFPPLTFFPLCCGLTDPVPRFPQLPAGIAVDAPGNLYIVDSGNQRVRKVSNGVITTIAGNGTTGYSGDGGLAANAQLNNPSGIALDAAGKVYVSDSGNGRIRALLPAGCSFNVTPPSIQTSTAGGMFPITIQTGASCSWLVSGFPSWITLAAPPPIRGTATISLIIAANTGAARIANLVVADESIMVTEAPASGFAPTISLIANAFGDSPTIAPNTWVEIKGSNLAPASDIRAWKDSDFANNQMPSQLDLVSATVNGKGAYVYYISPTQVNILTPPNPLSGAVQVQLTVAGVTSNIFTVQTQPQSLSFFEFVSSRGLHYVYGRHLADNTIIGPTTLFPGQTTPVKPGETIYVAGNGFGTTDMPVVSGAVTQSGTLPKPWPSVQIAGVPVTVLFAGIVGPGTYIFNITLPVNIPDGDLALTATYDGLSIQSNLLISILH